MYQKYVFTYDLTKETAIFNIVYDGPDDVATTFRLGEPLGDPDMRQRPGYTPHAFLYSVCECGAQHTEAVIVGFELMDLSLPDVEALIVAIIDQVTTWKFVFIESRIKIDEMIKEYRK